MAQGIHTTQMQFNIIEANSHTSAQPVPLSHWDWKFTLTLEQRLKEDHVWRHETANGKVPQCVGIHVLSLS
jgi:hypothetical protein